MVINLKIPRRGKRHYPSKTWRKSWILIWIGRLDGNQHASLLLLGKFETRVSLSQHGRIWRAAK